MHQTWPAWSVCDVKTLLSVFLFSYFSSACADINTSEEAKAYLRLQKPECFICYTKRYVQYYILLFMRVTAWKHDWERIHFSEFIWVFEFWDALGTLGFSVFCLFIGTKRR